MNKFPRKFKVGDKVWFIPGYAYFSLLAIECTVVSIDNDQIPYYNLDIPVGHSVGETELFLLREDAKRALLARFEREAYAGELAGAYGSSVPMLREVMVAEQAKDYYTYFINAAGALAGSHREHRWSSLRQLLDSMGGDRNVITLDDALGNI